MANTRRSLLASLPAAALGAAVAAPAVAAATGANPDAELIALCEEYLALDRAFCANCTAGAHMLADDPEWIALHEEGCAMVPRLHELEAEIATWTAETPEGLRALVQAARHSISSDAEAEDAGALAGVAAVWIADKLDWSLYRSGGQRRVRQTEVARPGGMDPAHALAAKAADAVGADIGDRKDNPAGRAVHYALGAGMGALYGVLRGVSPRFAAGRGALFGLVLFVLKDEVANTALGTGGSPLDYPLADHARGAGAHMVFGVVTDALTRLFAPWRDQVVIERGPPVAERIDRGRRYLVEQGRPYVEQGRQFVEQGRRALEEQAPRYVEQGRQYVQQGRRSLEEQAPHYLDTAQRYAEQGRRYAARLAERAHSSMPEMDTADIARAGKRLYRRYT